MSKWMDLLRERKNSFTSSPEPTEPTKAASVGFVGTSPEETRKNQLLDTGPPGASDEPTPCLGCGRRGKTCEEILPYGTGLAKWWLHPECHRAW
jgi:hypothetical protein